MSYLRDLDDEKASFVYIFLTPYKLKGELQNHILAYLPTNFR